MRRISLAMLVSLGTVVGYAQGETTQATAAPVETKTASTEAKNKSEATKTSTSKKSDEKKSDEKKATMSLAEARGRIGSIIEQKSGAEMSEVMKQLSAEDQKQFLADVNKAISELPASIEEKTAKYITINRAAVTSAVEGNTKVLIAEVFATVQIEALTVLNENFAQDLLKPSENSGITDEKYREIALDLMKTVNERVAETDNASTRAAFAIITLLRAANNPTDELIEKLVETLPEEARELAQNEWIPAALGKDGREQGYEPLLASADAGRRPDLDFTLVIVGPQHLDSVLQDLSGKNVDQMSFMQTRTPVLDAVENPLVNQVPTMGGEVGTKDKTVAEETEETSGKPVREDERVTPEPEPEPEPEPGPYFR